MKKIWLNLVVVGLGAIAFSSCSNPEKMKEFEAQMSMKVSPEMLVAKADTVEATITVTFPAKYFHKKATVEFTPVLKYDGGEFVCDPKLLQGESVKGTNTVIRYEAGGSYTQTVKIPFKDVMRSSTLEMRKKLIVGDKNITWGDNKIADGVIATYKLVEVDPKVIAMTQNSYVKSISDSKMAQILFQINRDVINDKEVKKEDIKAIEDYIANAKKDSTMQLKEIGISAYASPDGPMTLNEKLSKGRGSNSAKYLEKYFKKSKVKGVDSLYKVTTTAEDWDGFKTLMEQSNIQDKDLVLRVLSMYSDPAVREKEIKNISKAFKIIAEQILPQLRRAKFAASVEKMNLNDDQLKALAAANKIDSLSLEQLIYTAGIVTDKAQKTALYNMAETKYPTDIRAFNNLGVMAFNDGNMDEAKAQFTKGLAINKDNSVVKNNMGAILLKQGNVDAAEKMFTEAADAGKEVRYNLGIVSIMKGKYEPATDYFGGSDSFNQGLALYLVNKADESKRILDKVDSGKSFYLKAVIAARQGNEADVLNNMRTAVGKDASLKAYAMKDMEFKSFMQNEVFKTLLQ
jgi:Flp pilus assembly protein TadD, contains TPR repeats